MIDNDKRIQREQEKAKTRRRMNAQVDLENYEYIPAEKETDYYDTDTHQRGGIYVRVSTDDVRQTTSFELQKKYYEDFVSKHDNWELVNIYADEGISGTSLAHRDAFNQMINDCKEGKLDLIITKSVSRFARNVVDFIGMVRKLAHLKPPVGVFFESECIFSLKDDSQMALTFQATMAEEESHTRSRSMETSLRMRLDNGIPLTPKLLGYTHDEDGHLIINQDEAPTVKLAFFMYLYGYSAQHIANALNALGRKSYLGNCNWTSNGIIQILRNERHCGDVLTRKTWTPDYHDHKSEKNRGKRPQSWYHKHHEGIVSREDFIAVQHMIDNAKYKNKSFLPELRYIDSGILKGFVIINPRWAGFKEYDYIQACKKAYEHETEEDRQKDLKIEVSAGDFDLRGFEITRQEFFDSASKPMVVFNNKTLRFSQNIADRLAKKNYIEMLINPIDRKFAIRTTPTDNKSGVYCSSNNGKRYQAKEIPATAYIKTIYNLFSWNPEYRYRIIGSKYETDSEQTFIFDIRDSEAFFKYTLLQKNEAEETQQVNITPITQSRNRIRAIPEAWANSFGKPYYIHEISARTLLSQSEKEWQTRLEGQMFESGKRLNVTPFEELKAYISKELEGIPIEEIDKDNG